MTRTHRTDWGAVVEESDRQLRLSYTTEGLPAFVAVLINRGWKLQLLARIPEFDHPSLPAAEQRRRTLEDWFLVYATHDELTSLWQRLQSMQLPVITSWGPPGPPDKRCHLTVQAGLRSQHFQWWGDVPEEWKDLGGIVTELERFIRMQLAESGWDPHARYSVSYEIAPPELIEYAPMRRLLAEIIEADGTWDFADGEHLHIQVPEGTRLRYSIRDRLNAAIFEWQEEEGGA